MGEESLASWWTFGSSQIKYFLHHASDTKDHLAACWQPWNKMMNTTSVDNANRTLRMTIILCPSNTALEEGNSALEG